MDWWPERTGSDWHSNIQQCEKRKHQFEIEGSSGRESWKLRVCCFWLAISIHARFNIYTYIYICVWSMFIHMHLLRFALWLYLLVWDITKCNECPPWTKRNNSKLTSTVVVVNHGWQSKATDGSKGGWGLLCFSLFLSLSLPIYLPTYPPIYLCIHLSLSLCLSVCRSIYLLIYLSTYLSIYLSICLSIYLSVYLFN